MTHADLIRRLETDPPSDELLADALVALGWRKGGVYCDRNGQPVQYLRHPETGVEVPAPAWPQLLTTLDAVRPHMPEGWFWEVNGDGQASVATEHGEFKSEASTPAMALLAVILKAKETK